QYTLGCFLRVVKQCVRSRARNEPAVVCVITIGENLARDLQTMSLARAGKLALVRREQDQFRIDRFDGACDRVGEIRIPYRHVVQGAVWLDVVRVDIQSGSDRLKNPELISHGVEHFFGGYRQLLASEILAIEKTRMRSDSDFMPLRRGNGGVHRIG